MEKGRNSNGGHFLNESYVTEMENIWANQEQVFYIAKEEQTWTTKAAKHDCANFPIINQVNLIQIQLIPSGDNISVSLAYLTWHWRHPDHVNTEVC